MRVSEREGEMEQSGCEDVNLSDIITVSHVLFIVLIIAE